jgi:ribosome recycling factor
LLPDQERKDLIDALKKKWEIVHKEYQEITHISKIDTIGKKSKKERCEAELAQLEKDIQKLTKNYIFVDTLAPSTYY